MTRDLSSNRPALPTRPAAYARVSLDREGLSVGVDDQVRQMEAHAESLDWPKPLIYSDNDITASRSDRVRPDFERLLTDLASGQVDGLMVRHIDRLLRQVRDLVRVLDAIEASPREVQVVLLEGGRIDISTSSGRTLAYILAAVAQNESEVKAERLLQARRRDAQAGRAHQALGYGYNRDHTINETQADVVREVARRLLEEKESWGDVVADLNRRRVPTAWEGRWTGMSVKSLDTEWGRLHHPDLHAVIRLLRSTTAVKPAAVVKATRTAGAHWTIADVRKRPEIKLLADSHVGLTVTQVAQFLNASGLSSPARGWTGTSLRSMMTRGALCGWRDHAPGRRTSKTSESGRPTGELVAKGDWTPILTKKQVEQLRARSRTAGERQTEARHLLSGVLVCGRCGKPLVGAFSSDPRVVGKRGGTTWRYLCPKRKNAASSGCGLSVAGEDIDNIVTGWVLQALAETDFRQRGYTTSDDPRVRQAQDRLAGYPDEQERQNRLFRAGAIDGVTYEDNMMALQRRQDADLTIVNAAMPRRLALQVISEAPTNADDLLEWWLAKDLAGRRHVLRSLLASVPLMPSPTGKGRGTPPVERLGEPKFRV
ncbi:hypothetical protein E8D34_15930 [Nocardioides sp. GY 10113]|uniref:recombinase family protein n=1 Tax=Nocardioides sp. GY 10113 TaxID=2569761 RepID=UPI0010A94787|nr:recombinase family protein [Nocardioides sp. GY 10113]TIC83611.1 hypothetical protein E8D34_15930 [Nocardioides sp. GY 10113]